MGGLVPIYISQGSARRRQDWAVGTSYVVSDVFDDTAVVVVVSAIGKVASSSNDISSICSSNTVLVEQQEHQ